MRTFSNRNFLYLVFLYQLIFVKVQESSCTHSRPGTLDEQNNPAPKLLTNLKMKIITGPNQFEFVNLKQTNQILANKNLPVWIVNGVIDEQSLKNDCGNELKLDHEVMDRLGEFTMYQDPEASAAAVYFHHRRQFDGIIDYRYLIQELDIDLIDATDVNEFQVGASAVVLREKSMGHETEVKFHDKGKIPENGNKETMKSHAPVNHGYPEILVIVSCEMAQELMKTKSDSEKYTAIVSYVLTLFNGVDMLYSKLKYTKIELNIAGIIIVPECESFSFLKKCQSPMNDEENVKPMLDADCTNMFFQKYFIASMKTISTDSYDIVVYLTRNHLYHVNYKIDENFKKKEGKKIYVQGLAESCKNLYECRQDKITVILVATVHDRGNLENYAVLAHELAHLMTVRHDKSLSMKEGKCRMNIMKQSEGESWCRNCLSWSDASERKMKRFFSSPNCCIFINKPRSLYPPQPRQMLTANEQCQCYGFISAMIFQRMSMNPCESHIICRDDSIQFHKAPLPMDGTPCGTNMVCWNKDCVSLDEE